MIFTPAERDDFHAGRYEAPVNLVALMDNYAGTAALLTAFDMRLDTDQPPLVPQQ